MGFTVRRVTTGSGKGKLAYSYLESLPEEKCMVQRYCHIFIKGCSGEDYTGFFQTAGYIEQKTTPVCDSEQYCIVNT